MTGVQTCALPISLTPEFLLGELHRIERGLGRVRAQRWAARTIDLDIVRFGGRRVSSSALELPHPGLVHRDFWQREVAELEQLVGDRA